ncbi:MarR family winged helix-turn-helix transcriptional regulator [Terribacillus saccharophilus]|uniref:MarR family winged helix-turn-helix transcriptional regulator n=1 Tax=Terribacillus saccharophilus TaxID=361277 RepID=UPI003981CD39
MEKDFTLEDHLCFSLYASSRAILRMYQPLLKKLDITYPQYLVLQALWEAEKQTIKQLGETLDLDTGTLTPLLKRMEAKQLISRQRSKEDERVVHVTLTDQGEALKQEAACIPLALVSSSGMSSEEIDQLNRLVKKLTTNLQQR